MHNKNTVRGIANAHSHTHTTHSAHNANSVRMARPGKHNHWVQLNCYLWRILCFIIISRVLFRSIGVRGILHNAHTRSICRFNCKWFGSTGTCCCIAREESQRPTTSTTSNDHTVIDALPFFLSLDSTM